MLQVACAGCWACLALKLRAAAGRRVWRCVCAAVCRPLACSSTVEASALCLHSTHAFPALTHTLASHTTSHPYLRLGHHADTNMIPAPGTHTRTTTQK
jgi:hypothetical protein